MNNVRIEKEYRRVISPERHKGLMNYESLTIGCKISNVLKKENGEVTPQEILKEGLRLLKICKVSVEKEIALLIKNAKGE